MSLHYVEPIQPLHRPEDAEVCEIGPIGLIFPEEVSRIPSDMRSSWCWRFSRGGRSNILALLFPTIRMISPPNHLLIKRLPNEKLSTFVT